MSNEKAISIPVKDIDQLKVLLATWYSFLQEVSNNFSDGDYASALKTPVIYDLANDRIEILFTGDEELLKKFKTHVLEKTE